MILDGGSKLQRIWKGLIEYFVLTVIGFLTGLFLTGTNILSGDSFEIIVSFTLCLPAVVFLSKFWWKKFVIQKGESNL